MTFDLNNTFVTSDYHFGSCLTRGPFKVFSLEQEKTLIDKWNSVVEKDATVIYNGDFCDCSILDAVKYKNMLNGHVILVKGNHDTFPDYVYTELFDDVFNEIVLDNFGIVIHHKPDESLSCNQIYGHMHRGYIVGPLDKKHNFCSCVQAHDGFPVLLRDALASFTQQSHLADCSP